MTITDLAALDAAYRRDVVAGALTEERRGLELAEQRAGRTANFLRNIERLEIQLRSMT